MAQHRIKKSKRNSNTSNKQGHKLVYLTLIIILIPCAIVGFVLLTSIGGQNKPVVGNRFSKHDLQPAIQQGQLDTLEQNLTSVAGLEEVTVTLKSATVRVNLNLYDGASEEEAQAAAESAYVIVNDLLPVDEYFTNKENGKMYDMEIDAYNYVVDEQHSLDGYSYVKITKTGAGPKVIDVMSSAKNPELAEQVRK